MDKFISAERVKKGLEELGRSPWANETALCPRNIAIKDALGTVKDLCIEKEPAADVALCKTGKWEQVDRGRTYECSGCGTLVNAVDPDTYFYCPNCGAKMDGGGDNG